jgi:hypothetical protein
MGAQWREPSALAVIPIIAILRLFRAWRVCIHTSPQRRIVARMAEALEVPPNALGRGSADHDQSDKAPDEIET